MTEREYRIAVDIGGTFTDCIVTDDAGDRIAAKALTTHDRLADGVLDSIAAAAAELGTSTQEILERTDMFVHGTTVATNALLTRRGVRVGLITTIGHEDVLAIGKVSSKKAGLTEREIVHSSQLAKPAPLIDHDLVIGVTERTDAAGNELVALDESATIAAVERLVAAGVEAIAVVFLWSFLDPRHEQRVREIIRERVPDMFVSLSSDIAPSIGEYERATTTAVNAYVGPIVARYLIGLQDRLQSEGLRRPLFVMQANGGLTSVEDASGHPIVTLDSGPTGGILGSQFLGETYAEPNVICTDVGGTSFEVGLVLGGALPLDDDPVVSQLNLRLPKVTVRSIGAGGGSIAWIDSGGLLRVGPQSAGSRPGPACYGLGGEQATVTDADLVLGYLDADTFLGGRMVLRKDLAYRALEKVGRPLGLEPEEAAAGIFRIINAQMADLIRKTTIEQGHDPRACILVSYGGAGPTHAAYYGRDIGAKSIVIPARSTVFSAEGMLTCDIVHSAQGARFLESPFTADDLALLERDMERLEGRVREQFAYEGLTTGVHIDREIGVRYRRQFHTIPVDFDGSERNEEALDVALQRRFERRYGELYGEASLLPRSGIELDYQRAIGRHRLQRPVLVAAEQPEGHRTPHAAGERAVYWEGAGFTSTPVYRGDDLAPGDLVHGPAVIQRMGDSVVVPPGFSALVDQYLSIRLSQDEEHS